MGDVESLELLLRIRTEGEQALKKTAEDVKAVGGSAKTAAAEIEKVKSGIKSFGSSGIADVFKGHSETIGKFVSDLKSKFSGDGFDNVVGGIERAVRNPLDALSSGIGSTLRSLGPGGTIVAGAVGGIAMVGRELANTVREFAEGQHEIAEFGERLGLTAGQAKELVKTAQLAGVNVYALEGSSRILAAALEDVTGQGARAGKVLEKLGVDTRQYGGESREMGGVLLDVIDGLSKISNHTEMVRESTLLLGRGSKEILPLIKNYQEFKGVMRELGVSFDSDAINKAAKTAEEFRKLDIVWGQLKESLKEKISPVVIPVIVELTKLLHSGQPKEGPEPKPELGGFDDNPLLNLISPVRKIDFRYEGSVHPGWSPYQAAWSGPANAMIDSFTKQGEEQSKQYKEKSLREDAEFIKKRVETLKKENAELATVLASDKVFGGTRFFKEEEYKKNDAEIKMLERRAKAIESMPDLIDALSEKVKAAQAQELVGVEKINAEHDIEIEKLRAKGTLTEKTEALMNKVHESNLRRYQLQAAQEQIVQDARVRTAAIEGGGAVGKAMISGAGSLRELALQPTNPREAVEEKFMTGVAEAEEAWRTSVARVQQMRDDSAAREKLQHDETKLVKEENDIRVEGIKAAQAYALAYYAAVTEKQKALMKLEEDARKADREVFAAGVASTRNDLTRAATRAQRIADITAGPGGEVRAIETAYRVRKALAEDIRRIEEERIAKETDANKRRVDQANLEKEIRQQIGEAELDREMKLLELRQKRTEEAKNEAGKIYDSMSGSGGMSGYFKDQIQKLQRQIFVNLASGPIEQMQNSLSKAIGGQRDKDGNLTFVGRMLQGTILGQRDQISPEVASRKENTSAIRDLTTTIRTAQAAAPGSSGAPAGSGQASTAGGATGASSASSGGWLGGLAAGAMLAGSIASLFSSGKPGVKAISGPGSGSSGASSGGLDVASIVSGGAMALTAIGSMFTSKSSGGSGGSGGSSGAGKTMGDFSSGFAAGPAGGMSGLLKTYSDDDASTATKVGQTVALGAAVAGGVMSTIQSFKQGGARGVVGGISSAAATAAMLDPEPISKGILTAVAAVGGIVKGLFGDPKAERQKDIDETLARHQYIAPPAINASQSLSGFNLAYDKYGKPMMTPFTGYDVTQATLYQNQMTNEYFTTPGYVTAGGRRELPSAVTPSMLPTYRGGSGSVTIINMNVHAIDSKSIIDRSADIGMAVYKELNAGGALGLRIQQTVLGGA